MDIWQDLARAKDVKDFWRDGATERQDAEQSTHAFSTWFSENNLASTYLDIAQAFEERHGLRRTLVRVLSIGAAQSELPRGSAQIEVAWRAGKEWLGFLCSDKAIFGSVYLQQTRTQDKCFYENGLVRKSLDEAAFSEDASSPQWVTKSFLRTASIADLEIGLVIFKWKEQRPTLVDWLKGGQALLLDTVQQALLRRYSFRLSTMLNKAVKRGWANDAGDSEKPRVSPLWKLWRIYPRIGGLVLVGFLVFVGAAPVFGMSLRTEAAPWAFAVSLFGLFCIWTFDVLRRNGSFLALKSACWRAAALGCRFVPWTILLGVIVFSLWFLAGWAGVHPDTVAALPHAWCGWGASFLLKFASSCSMAALLGSLIEWLWQGRSAVEPL